MNPEELDDAMLTRPETAEDARVNESHDEENRLKSDFVRKVREALDEDETDRVYALVEPLHPADIADLFELIDRDERLALARAINDLMSSEVFAELNDHVRELLVEELPANAVADIADQLETDDAVAMLEDLDEDDQLAVLAEMEPEGRAAIESALAYPEETAGRLMSRDLVAVPEHMRVGDLIDYLRENHDLATEFWEVFIVDAAHRPVGTCALSWILRSPRHIALTDVMKRDQTLIPVMMDQEEVALRFQKYALISAAVVDEAGRLVGQITVDDVVHIIQEEAGEDVLLLSGAGDGDINEPIALTVRSRLTWLVVNLGTAAVAASVVGLFQDGRQCGNPDPGGNGSRARYQSADQRQHLADDRPRGVHRLGQRPGPGRADRNRRRPGLRHSAARCGDRSGHADQQPGGGHGRHSGAGDPRPDAHRSGGVIGGLRDHGDRRHGLLQLPRPGGAGRAGELEREAGILNQAVLSREGGDLERQDGVLAHIT
jgi:flagellar motility protein MotE (MotC chaperone)